MKYMGARQQIMYLMQKHKVHVAALQETHVSYTGKVQHGNSWFYLSSNVDDEQRKQTDIQLETISQRLRKKEITEVEAKRERMIIITGAQKNRSRIYLQDIFFRQCWDWHQISQPPVDEDRVQTNTSSPTVINLYPPQDILLWRSHTRNTAALHQNNRRF
jgi:hypothetical protein